MLGGLRGTWLGQVSPTRQVAAWILAVAGPALLTLAALGLRSSLVLGGFLFSTLLVVMAVAVIGGKWPALAGVALGALARVVFFVPPFGIPGVDLRPNLVSLVGFTVAGGAVSILIGKLVQLGAEQTALRRVATLVAYAAPADELFAAVTEEVGRLIAVDFVRLARYDSDDSLTVVAAWSRTGEDFPVDSRWPLAGAGTLSASRTGRPARIDNIADASEPIAVDAREHGIRSAAAVPIIVEDRIWGVMLTGSSQKRAPSAGTEARLASFTELVATAISNAENLEELTTSRARVVAAADQTRRRIERDLHDGAQQRLVSLALALRAAQAAVPPGLGDLGGELADVADGLVSVMDDLREMARGIHPGILSEGGLAPALKMLARRSAVPVQINVHADARLPERVEVAAYYVVSEALTNAAKHAHASVVHVSAETAGQVLHLHVRDDGTGGADPHRGSGLIGLKDRVEALGGTITVDSAAGVGTSLHAELPFGD